MGRINSFLPFEGTLLVQVQICHAPQMPEVRCVCSCISPLGFGRGHQSGLQILGNCCSGGNTTLDSTECKGDLQGLSNDQINITEQVDWMYTSP